MEKGKRYDLTDKTREPEFEYILLTGSNYVDYYLYNEDELEEAFDQLRAEAAKGYRTASLCRKHFSNYDHSWRAERLFKIDCNHKVVLNDDPQNVCLHLAFYINAGWWMNPKS